MFSVSDSLYMLCKEDGETSLHFLGCWAVTMAIRRDINWRAHYVFWSGETTLLQHSLEVCESLSEIYIILPVSLGCALDPSCGLCTWWNHRWWSHPPRRKGKGKGKTQKCALQNTTYGCGKLRILHCCADDDPYTVTCVGLKQGP